jgi:hypothetical protein
VSARWHCRLCPTYGDGGPIQAKAHIDREHRIPQQGASASVGMGFVPQWGYAHRRFAAVALPGQPRPDYPEIEATA